MGGRVGAIIVVEPAALHTFFGPVVKVKESLIIFPLDLSLQGKYTPIS
jgi:hypothetical protein